MTPIPIFVPIEQEPAPPILNPECDYTVLVGRGTWKCMTAEEHLAYAQVQRIREYTNILFLWVVLAILGWLFWRTVNSPWGYDPERDR